MPFFRLFPPRFGRERKRGERRGILYDQAFCDRIDPRKKSMRALFEHWKYIFKNFWFVLPFALLPAVFLALSLDYSGINVFVRAFCTGDPRTGFLDYFRVWSMIRVDSLLGGIFDLLAFVCIVVFVTLLLALVEKHMRIGKRTLSGLYSEFWNLLLPVLLITLAYLALYELWAVILAALLFVIAQFQATALVYFFSALVFLLVTFALLYAATVLYLWLPCKQVTGFGAYEAFVYSYRLMTGVRWQLLFSLSVSFLSGMVVVGAAAFLPEAAFRPIVIVLYCLLISSFSVRMETVYFRTDKLDREDLLLSYRGY